MVGIEETKVVDTHKEMIDKEMTKMNEREESKEASSDPSPEKKPVGEPDNKDNKVVKPELSDVEKAEVQAKEDERILGAEDTDLSDEDVERKTELTKVKKTKDDQTNLDKRFSDLTGKIKDLERGRGSDKDLIESLKDELAELKTAPSIKKDEVNLEKKVEQDRITKYLNEDIDKPREERREIAKEDLDDWYLEDPISCTEWMQERSLRRADARKADKNKADKVVGQQDFDKKTKDSQAKAQERHPELNVQKRVDELKAEGKNDAQIHRLLTKENEKYGLVFEIAEDNPEFMTKANYPELIADEIDKRLKVKPKDEESEEDKIARIEEAAAEKERQRQADLDEGISSTAGKGAKTNETSPMYKMQLKAMIKSGGTKEDLDLMLARRKKIPGASVRD